MKKTKQSPVLKARTPVIGRPKTIEYRGKPCASVPYPWRAPLPMLIEFADMRDMGMNISEFVRLAIQEKIDRTFKK